MTTTGGPATAQCRQCCGERAQWQQSPSQATASHRGVYLTRKASQSGSQYARQPAGCKTLTTWKWSGKAAFTAATRPVDAYGLNSG
eukprot:81838-Chlamydomonas_euryale.AAC.4